MHVFQIPSQETEELLKSYIVGVEAFSHHDLRVIFNDSSEGGGVCGLMRPSSLGYLERSTYASLLTPEFTPECTPENDPGGSYLVLY